MDPDSAQHQARERTGGFTGESLEEQPASAGREARIEPMVAPMQTDMLEEIKEAGTREEQEGSQQRLEQARPMTLPPRKSTKTD